MAGSIKDYRKMVEEPWGRMFYDQIYRQRRIKNPGFRCRILHNRNTLCKGSSCYGGRTE